MTDCRIEIWEQPATKVKFRMEVHGHRCQSKELLVGRHSTEEERIFPLVKVICGGQGGRIRESLRRDLFVRMSLVDIRSSSSRIFEHYHQMVDCDNTAQRKSRFITKQLTGTDDRVIFDKLGIVKTLEKDKEDEVTQRMIARREEAGVRLTAWDKQDIRDKASREVKETSPYRLKLMFQSFLYDEGGAVVKVAPDVFSDEIVDLTNTTTGELAVRMRSTAYDTAMGGSEIMMFTGGGKPECKVSHARSIFQAEFFELDPQDPHEQKKVWRNVVDILEDELHTVGQFLGGIHFRIPPYRDHNITVATENVYCQLIKKNKAKTDQIQAKSDPLPFKYIPLPGNLQRTIKRPMHQQILQTCERVHGPVPCNVPFVSEGNTDIPTKIKKSGPTLSDLLPVVKVSQPSHQRRCSSLQDTMDEIRDNPQLLTYRDTQPAPSPSYDPTSPFSPSLNSPNPPPSQDIPTHLSPTHALQFMGSTISPSSSPSGGSFQTLSLNPSSHSPISMNPPTISRLSQIPIKYSAISVTPSSPSTMSMTLSSPSAMSMNPSTNSSVSMVLSTPSSTLMIPSSNSSNMLLVDPHGLGNASSSSANSPRMVGLWNTSSAQQQNSFMMNLGPDLGILDFGDLLEDAANQLGGGSGIQPDSESYGDIFVHEIIATDGCTPQNNANTTEIKEEKRNKTSEDSIKKSPDSKNIPSPGHEGKPKNREKTENESDNYDAIEKVEFQNQNENNLSEAIENLKLN